MTPAAVVQLSDENFQQQVVKCHLPVLVTFRADWCMPCQLVEPILEQLAADYDGRLKVGALDVDENTEVPVKYSVNPLPTILLFKSGDVLREFVGVQEKRELTAALKAAIG